MSARDESRPANDRLPERSAFLVLLATGPAIWAAHFLATYVTVSVWCARFAGAGGPLAPVGLPILLYTVAALAAIGAIGWSGYRRHGYGAETLPHDMDTPADRHRFLGFSTLLLAGLSALATIYVAWSTTFFEVCR